MIYFYTSAKPVKSFHTGFSGKGGGTFGPREPPGGSRDRGAWVQRGRAWGCDFVRLHPVASTTNEVLDLESIRATDWGAVLHHDNNLNQ